MVCNIIQITPFKKPLPHENKTVYTAVVTVQTRPEINLQINKNRSKCWVQIFYLLHFSKTAVRALIWLITEIITELWSDVDTQI
jgi:hypothetical protein